MPLSVSTTPDLTRLPASTASPPEAPSEFSQAFSLPHIMLFSWPEQAVATLLAQGYSPRDAVAAWKASVQAMLERYRQAPEASVLIALGSAGIEPWLLERWPDLTKETLADLGSVALKSTDEWYLLVAKELVERDASVVPLLEALAEACAPLAGSGYSAPAINVDAVFVGEQGSARQLQAENEVLEFQLQQLEQSLELFYLENQRLRQRQAAQGPVLSARGGVAERKAPLWYRALRGYRSFRAGLGQAVRPLMRPFAYFTRRHWQVMAEVKLVAASEYFDANWYLFHNPDVREVFKNPAEHYVRHGGAEGRDPGPRFSSQRYLDANPDVVRARINPLVHYLQHGKAEGRAFPHP